MTWVPLDCDYMSDPKILRAGALAELLFVRGLALSKRLMSDGEIEAVHLPGLALGIPGKPAAHASALVTAGLWDETQNGWQIVSWGKRNKSRAEIREHSEQLRLAGLKGNHDRWHSDAKRNRNCPFCYPTPDPNRITNGIRARPKADSPETETETETENYSSSYREIVHESLWITTAQEDE